MPCMQDIVHIVKDTTTFPSPVLAVGAMFSVTPILTNPGGTIVNMLAMNKVLKLDTAARSVTVQAGITLGDLHDYLADKVRG